MKDKLLYWFFRAMEWNLKILLVLSVCIFIVAIFGCALHPEILGYWFADFLGPIVNLF